jgi:hypothetical protein
VTVGTLARTATTPSVTNQLFQSASVWTMVDRKLSER